MGTDCGIGACAAAGIPTNNARSRARGRTLIRLLILLINVCSQAFPRKLRQAYTRTAMFGIGKVAHAWILLSLLQQKDGRRAVVKPKHTMAFSGASKPVPAPACQLERSHFANSCEVALSECMVRRRVASEKRSMAVGLRQCIRPLLESMTPGHDGYPLALVRIMWTVS